MTSLVERSSLYHSDVSTHTNSRKRSRDLGSLDSSSSTSSSSSFHLSTYSHAVKCRVVNASSALGFKNLSNVQDVLCYLMSFLEVDELKSVVFVSRSLSNASKLYFQMLLNASTFYINVSSPISSPNNSSEDDKMKFNFPNLNKAVEMLQILSTLKGHNPNKKITLKLDEGVHEVVGTWTAPWGTSYQQTLSINYNNISIVGKKGTKKGKEGKTTIVHGGLVAENGRSLSITNLTIKNLNGRGLFISGEGTTINMNEVIIKECKSTGVDATNGAKINFIKCHFYQNEGNGLEVDGITTIASLMNCTFHHNKYDGVWTDSGAIVDLMGEETSVHDNGRFGLAAYHRGSTINVCQPCVLDDISDRNKTSDIYMGDGGSVVQSTTTKKE